MHMPCISYSLTIVWISDFIISFLVHFSVPNFLRSLLVPWTLVALIPWVFCCVMGPTEIETSHLHWIYISCQIFLYYLALSYHGFMLFYLFNIFQFYLHFFYYFNIFFLFLLIFFVIMSFSPSIPMVVCTMSL